MRAKIKNREKQESVIASFHLSVKTISRSAGRSATGAAAYRAGVTLIDDRTGIVHDYSRRTGIDRVGCAITLPPGSPEWASDRSALWNAAERSETRKNSTVAREFEIALPAELSAEQRRELVSVFARELSDRHGIAVDAAIHTPGREGDSRNHHAHVLTSTRRLGLEGFGEKARELDDQTRGPLLVKEWRERWGELQNLALERAGAEARVDHRSYVDQREAALERGEVVPERVPTVHMGPGAMAVERKAQRQWRGAFDREAGASASPSCAVTERGQRNASVVVENATRVQRVRHWLAEQFERVGATVKDGVRHAERGMEAFTQRFDQVQQGMERFLERFQQWEGRQAEQAAQVQRSIRPERGGRGRGSGPKRTEPERGGYEPEL